MSLPSMEDILRERKVDDKESLALAVSFDKWWRASKMSELVDELGGVVISSKEARVWVHHRIQRVAFAAWCRAPTEEDWHKLLDRLRDG